MNKFLIVGLGNIGAEYEDTRHNIGFTVADALVADAGSSFRQDRHAYVAALKYKGRQIVVVKPTTYMNLSGTAVRYWMQKESIDPQGLLVIVDELALPFGKLRLGPKGSDGGHNGLKNIQEVLGTTEYPRLRFGIGNEYAKGRQVEYVLGKWSAEEKAALAPRVDVAVEAIKAFVFAGLQRAMNNYNTR